LVVADGEAVEIAAFCLNAELVEVPVASYTNGKMLILQGFHIF
jgi:hypothetical protein